MSPTAALLPNIAFAYKALLYTLLLLKRPSRAFQSNVTADTMQALIINLMIGKEPSQPN